MFTVRNNTACTFFIHAPALNCELFIGVHDSKGKRWSLILLNQNKVSCSTSEMAFVFSLRQTSTLIFQVHPLKISILQKPLFGIKSLPSFSFNILFHHGSKMVCECYFMLDSSCIAALAVHILSYEGLDVDSTNMALFSWSSSLEDVEFRVSLKKIPLSTR